jgi:hypothetical protein
MNKFFAIIAITTLIAPVSAFAGSKQTTKKQVPAVEDFIPCGTATTPAQLRVTETTEGYRKVEITVDFKSRNRMPDEEFANKVSFAFAIESPPVEIRQDALGAIKWVSRCSAETLRNGRVYNAGSTWLKVTTMVTHRDVWDDHMGMTIRAFVWLPQAVIDFKPDVHTILRDNVRYSGSWNEVNGQPVLAIKPD